MFSFKSFKQKLFRLNADTFEELALTVFHHQAQHNLIYKEYIRQLGIRPPNITSVKEIPFLPISFYKRHAIKTGSWKAEKIYESSGTTGMVTSKHHVKDNAFYLEVATRIFSRFYGALDQFHFLFLLPSYLERSGSSLVAMAQHFITNSESELAGFYLHNYDELVEKISFLRRDSQNGIILCGVTYALLDLAEQYAPDLSGVVVMETGGMKGRRKERVREDLHNQLKSAFKVNQVHSEYGMTELLSQAYSNGEGRFFSPPWMKIILRDPNDPLDLSTQHRTGGINVVDLANVHSCAFIETQDLGRVEDDGSFEILGRFDNSDIRGCNLLI